MRAAMYLRQSVDRDGNELAVSRQRDDCVALCERNGWTYKPYVDNDKSATNGKPRPEYQRMLADIRAGKVDAVVVWDLDRLHRQPIELEHFMKLADEKQLRLATATGDVDLSTDNGRLFARIKGAVGMSEVERKSARQKAANAQRAKDEGGPWWPSRPFGYDAAPDRETGKWWTVKRAKGQPPKFNPIWLDPTEAALVRQAYRDFNAGATLRSLAARWNAAGVLTPKGNPWTGTQVRALLMSERNAGLRPCREKGPDGKVKTRLVPGTWDAIVTENVWRMAVRKLSNPKRRSGPSRGRKYLLSGIARCGRKGCGAPLGSAISSRGQRQYHCNRCQKISRDVVKVDQPVTERVVWRLSKPDAVELLESDNDDVDTDALREQRQALEDRLAQLGKDFATARPEFTQAALAHATEQLEAINAVLETPAKARIFEGVIGAKDVRAAFAGLDLGRQRTIVNALLAIRVKPVGKGTGPVFDTSAIEMRWKQ